MAQNIQEYQVNYLINVESTKGTQQVKAFAESINQLVSAEGIIKKLRSSMGEVNKLFDSQKNRKRNHSFTYNIDTQKTEEKLERIKVLLGEIKDLSKGINININSGQPLKGRTFKNNVKKAIGEQTTPNTKNAKNSTQNLIDTQRLITKSVGKINSAFIHLEKGREINIKTDVAKQRLLEIHSLLLQIRSGSQAITLGNIGNRSALSHTPSPVIPFHPDMPFAISDKAQQKIQEQLYARQQFHKQKQQFEEENQAKKQQLNAAEKLKKEQEKARKAYAAQQKKIQANELKKEQQRIKEELRADKLAKKELQKLEKERQKQIKKQEQERVRQQQRTAAEAVRNMQRHTQIDDTLYGNRRRAAINRLQYSKRPTLRSLPMGYMLNAYMGYSLMKSEIGKAVDYSNIMQTAHSILKVADTDLGTFDKRFDMMARNVRRVGVETKFTAIEIAGAVKYLSMAGMGIDTINDSIRPITNLALIGDNDVSQIADLATNIMAGYNIKSTSMGSVADILASTVSRSNVSIIEMAESFKMAAGYLKLSGVDFTEAAAAIGILGNAGIKGTMSGTALRAMSTRFAKPTKEARKAMSRLNIKFTEHEEVFGKKIEKLRPLADIFKELDEKGATIADMQMIFGKIGGNAGMMLLKNHEKLRELTSQNQTSQGVSEELAKVKQETTKGLWFQMTSMFSESFMQGYEILEPQIKSFLRDLVTKFRAPDFTQGLASIGRALLDILHVFSSIANTVLKNFHWLEPLIFTGFVATKLFKLAGALTNVGVAIGFIGKQSIATSSLQAISSLVGIGPGVVPQALSFANKRAIVSSLQAVGVSGKGSGAKALAAFGGGKNASAIVARGAATGVFSNQVAVGNGFLGAGSSIAALGTGALVATAAFTALAGAIAWVGYKTWQVKAAKDAMLEELAENRKYRYSSVEDLYDALDKTYKRAKDAKQAVDELTDGKTLQEASGHKIGAFTTNWWSATLNSLAAAGSQYNPGKGPTYTYDDAFQSDAKEAILALAERDGQARINSAYADLGKFKDKLEVAAFIQNIDEKYTQSEKTLDPSLWTLGKDNKIWYNKDIGKLKASEVYKTYHYADHINKNIVPTIVTGALAYQTAISSFEGAKPFLEKAGVNFKDLAEAGLYRDNKGIWRQKQLKNATDEEIITRNKANQNIRDSLVSAVSNIRQQFGGSAEIAANIMQTAGFSPSWYSSEPNYNTENPTNANGITNPDYGDDGMAGGNYSGTGKLSSAAPKQVIVSIKNLLSIETIELLKTKEGNESAIQNLKEQMAQALVEVVHDFDASWNG